MTQEMASVAKAITALLTGYNVFYNHVPEGYAAPAVYFPIPTVEVESDSLDGFKYDYSWYIKVFHKTTHQACDGATLVQRKFKEARNLVPIIDENGDETGKYLRVKDVKVNEIEERTIQVYVRWHSHRGYEVGDMVQDFNVNFQKGE